jgi:transcriptional regulator with XRE-family HTH domain
VNWEKGEGEPTLKELLLLTNFFNISVDRMLTVDLEKEADTLKTKKSNLSINDLSEEITEMRTAIEELRKHIKHGRK